MLTPHGTRVGPGARKMSNKGVKQCQENEGADSKVTAKQGTMCGLRCARGQDGISWAFQIIVGDPEGFR